MKVKELIAKLREFDEDLEVLAPANDGHHDSIKSLELGVAWEEDIYYGDQFSFMPMRRYNDPVDESEARYFEQNPSIRVVAING